MASRGNGSKHAVTQFIQELPIIMLTYQSNQGSALNAQFRLLDTILPSAFCRLQCWRQAATAAPLLCTLSRWFQAVMSRAITKRSTPADAGEIT